MTMHVEFWIEWFDGDSWFSGPGAWRQHGVTKLHPEYSIPAFELIRFNTVEAARLALVPLREQEPHKKWRIMQRVTTIKVREREVKNV